VSKRRHFQKAVKAVVNAQKETKIAPVVTSHDVTLTSYRWGTTADAQWTLVQIDPEIATGSEIYTRDGNAIYLKGLNARITLRDSSDTQVNAFVRIMLIQAKHALTTVAQFMSADNTADVSDIESSISDHSDLKKVMMDKVIRMNSVGADLAYAGPLIKKYYKLKHVALFSGDDQDLKWNSPYKYYLVYLAKRVDTVAGDAQTIHMSYEFKFTFKDK